MFLKSMQNMSGREKMKMQRLACLLSLSCSKGGLTIAFLLLGGQAQQYFHSALCKQRCILLEL